MAKMNQAGDRAPGNRPRGGAGPAASIGEGGGPAGVERSGGPKPPRMPGAAPGTIPSDQQITPEDKLDRDTWDPQP